MKNTSFIAAPSNKNVCRRTIGIVRIAILSSLLLALSGSSALADCGPFGGGLDNHTCEANFWNFTSPEECFDMCEKTDYCMPYQDEKRTVFGGFWRYEIANFQPNVKYYCREACKSQRANCDANDQDCLARFEPQDPDCSPLTNEEDQAYCNQECKDNILTSECGRSCLKIGIENVSIEDGNITSIGGCRDQNAPPYCTNLCNDNYSASIPMNYKDRWGILGLLVALLAAMSVITLVAIHRKDKNQTEDKHS